MIPLRDPGRRDILRLVLPYLASVVVVGAVFVIQDSFLRNLSNKVLSVFQRDARGTAVTLADMAMQDKSAALFEVIQGPGEGSMVLQPSPELLMLLRLESASVVFGSGGGEPLARDSLEDAAVESGELLSTRYNPGDRGDSWTIQAVYPVTGSIGGVIGYSSVTMMEPYSIHWLRTLRYAMLVLFAVVLALVIFPRMLLDISELRRQRELDGFDQPSHRAEAEAGPLPVAGDTIGGVLDVIDRASGVPSLLLGPEGTIVYMSPAACLLFDVSAPEAEGRTPGELPSVRAGGGGPGLAGPDPEEVTLVHSSGERIRVWLRSRESGTGDGALKVVVASPEGAGGSPGAALPGVLRRDVPLPGSVAVISAMIRGFAHELNNLVGGIIGASSVGERMHAEPGPDRDRYRSIIAEATKASRIVRELRESTTPRTGDGGDRIDMRTELSEISEALLGVLPGNTPVVFDCSTDAVVEARSVVLRQLVYSLAIGSGNRARGPVRFSMTADGISREEAGAVFGEDAVRGAGDSFVRLSLSDGNPMPVEIRECFLDPGTDPARAQERLGASVATAIQAVQRLGTPLAFTPAPGGTVMQLLFRQVPAMPDSRSVQAGASMSGQGVSVLIAEDVALVRESLQEMLVHLGFDARGACDGDEALEILERERFDVLMLDLSMPGTPSLEVARRCRSGWPDLAILLTSGYDPGEEVRRAMDEMDIPFVAKPYLPEDVAGRIIEALLAAKDAVRGGGENG